MGILILIFNIITIFASEDGKNIGSQNLVPLNYTNCTTPNDCTNPNFPICLIYYEFDNITLGKCVQCISDCHCGVNEFCGPDLLSPTFDYSAIHCPKYGECNKRWIEGRAIQQFGLPLFSRCFRYNSDIIGGTCNPTINKNYIIRGKSEITYCGFTSTWGPSKTTCKGNCTDYIPKVVATNIFPGWCYPDVIFDYNETIRSENISKKETIPYSCMNELTLNSHYNFLFQFIAKREPIWHGNCEQGICKICSEGSTRCTGDTNGIAQICHYGNWIALANKNKKKKF